MNGPVAGMAVPIVACCDLRFAAAEASFMTAFSQRGLIAEWGSSWILPRLFGPAHALDLLFSARKVDAAEAERIGLVNRVVADDELLAFARQLRRGHRRQLLADLDDDHEAAGLSAPDRRPRRRREGGRRG